MENDDEAGLEAIFIAANVREVDTVEQILTAEGIEYEVRPQPFHRSGLFSSGELNGVMFEVLPGQADYCRKLLIAKGLRHGIVLPQAEDRLDFPPR